jgi:hypothetical protein
VIERPRIRRRTTADRVLPRHQMHYRNVAAVEPVTGEVEIRTEAYPEAEYVPVEITSRLEVVGLNRNVVKCIERHRGILPFGFRPAEARLTLP